MKPKFEIGDLVSHSWRDKGIIVGVKTCEPGDWREATYKVYFFRYGRVVFTPEYRLRKLEVMDDNQD